VEHDRNHVVNAARQGASDVQPVFIGGCGRSGTTMLGAMLGTHPHCLTTPEASFFFVPYRRHWATGKQLDRVGALERIVAHWSFKIWNVEIDRTRLLEDSRSYPELLLGIVGAYGQKVDKPEPRVWVDHAPGNVKYSSLLFEMFPEAKLIHMVRDGRATAASVMDLDWGPNNVASAAKWWVSFVSRGLAAESMYGPRVKRVRYESLVARPERTLEEVCGFVGLDFRPEMVGGTGFAVPHFTSKQHALVGRTPDRERLGAWRKALTPREIEVFESIAADLLAGLGYEQLHGWQARRLTSTEKVKFVMHELYRRNVVNRTRLRRRIRSSVADIETQGRR
jgi:hypothetical protein